MPVDLGILFSEGMSNCQFELEDYWASDHAELDLYDTEPADSASKLGRTYLEQLYIEHDRACDALEAERFRTGNLALDPFKRKSAGGNTSPEKEMVALVNECTGDMNVVPVIKGFQTLPLNAVKKRRQTLAPLVMYTSEQQLRTLRSAVVALGQRRYVFDLGSGMKEGFDEIGLAFRILAKTYPVELIFVSAEAPVRDHAGILHSDAQGLLYHLHFNLLFRVTRPMHNSEWRRFLRAFKRKLSVVTDQGGSYVHDCGTLRSIVAACEYFTKVSTIRDVLDGGEFVEWHNQLKGIRLTRAYGAFRKYQAALKKNGQRIAAEKVIDGAGPLWKWQYHVVNVQRRSGRERLVSHCGPLPPVANRLVARIQKQNVRGIRSRFAVFKNPSPGMTGRDLLAMAGLPVPV